jgi:nucleoside-diphosphate-sugar epimerase
VEDLRAASHSVRWSSCRRLKTLQDALGSRFVKASGRRIDARFGPARAVDTPVSVLDISSAGETFGWHPEIELSDGLSSTWQWLLAQGQDA